MIMNETTQPAAPGGLLRRRPLRRIIKNWRERHRHPFNYWFHMIGITLAIAGVLLFFFISWYWALATLVLGYACHELWIPFHCNEQVKYAVIRLHLVLS